jgi:uncharacterized YigZ family protein
MAKFLTILRPVQGLYKEKGSRFISFANPVSSLDEIEKYLAEIKKLHHDARHVCYAYRLGASKEMHKSSDAGEPANTAGAPILGQLKSFGVTNTLVIVVRYFGGIKLGVGGLISAYREAAKDALTQAQIIEGIEKEEFTVGCGYEELLALQKLLKEYKLEIISQEFSEKCVFKAAAPVEEAQNLRNLLHEKGWLIS